MLQAILLQVLESLSDHVLSPVWKWLSQRWSNRTRRQRVGLLSGIAALGLLAALGPAAYRLLRVTVDSHIPLGRRAAVSLEALSTYASARMTADITADVSSDRAPARLPVALFAGSEIHDDERQNALAALLAAVEPSCHCWIFGSESSHAPHVPSTAWSLLALAKLKSSPPESAFEALLASQRSSGAWSMHGGPESEFGSTYATALALLALQELVNADLMERRERLQAKRAIDGGHRWLVTRPGLGAARWSDYPDARGRPVYASISGLALYTLHHLGRDDEARLRSLDRSWLRSLPAVPPPWDSVETSHDLRVYMQGPIPDVIAYRTWPWMVLGTVAAYPSGSIREQHRAAGWLQRAVRTSGSSAALSSEFGPAEYLLALRELQNNAQ
jgi:hypothetical protein